MHRSNRTANTCGNVASRMICLRVFHVRNLKCYNLKMRGRKLYSRWFVCTGGTRGSWRVYLCMQCDLIEHFTDADSIWWWAFIPKCGNRQENRVQVALSIMYRTHCALGWCSSVWRFIVELLSDSVLALNVLSDVYWNLNIPLHMSCNRFAKHLSQSSL